MSDLPSRVVETYRHGGIDELVRETLSRIVRPVYNQYSVIKHGDSEPILDKDWDNLLLLDACRYDYFQRFAPVRSERINSLVTVDTNTPGFLMNTFEGETLHDTVYVTANPQVERFQRELSETTVFHDIVSVLDEWDPEIQTVHPEAVRRAAIEANEKYPEKRLIIHFLQPHAPFLGPTARCLRDRTGETIGGFDPGREYTSVSSREVRAASYEDVLSDYENVDTETVRTAYAESIQIVLNECLELVCRLSGRTAITADHGELLGERLFPLGRQRWEHPGDIRASELCIVPYVEFDHGPRKHVTADPPNIQGTSEKSVVEQRLKSLGYK